MIAGLVIPPERIGTGQSFFASTRAVTGTIASKFTICNFAGRCSDHASVASIYLAIYNGRLKTNLPRDVSSYVLDAGLPQSSLPQVLSTLSNGTVAALQNVPGMNSTIIAAFQAGQKRAWSASLSTVYLSALAFGGTALILSFFARDVDQYLTSFVNKTVSHQATRQDLEKD